MPALLTPEFNPARLPHRPWDRAHRTANERRQV